MPSWFHWIGIALNFSPLLFLLQLVLYLIQICSLSSPTPLVFLPALLPVRVRLLDPPSLNAFWTMSVLSRLTAASHWLCLQVCVTNKTLVSIDQLLSYSCLSACALQIRRNAFTDNLPPSCGLSENCRGPLSFLSRSKDVNSCISLWLSPSAIKQRILSFHSKIYFSQWSG